MRISGALHYFRVHPDQWATRLAWLRHLGLDTVETYVPWNLHEPRPGEHRFDGIADLDRFLDEAAAAGLEAIVRPGPYICAEWDNGGLPSWLTGRPGIVLRTCDPAYLAAVDAWFDVLVPRLAARQTTRGGPVALVQVENEYGSFGSDAGYLAHLRDGLRARGIDVGLVTSDGADDWYLTGGTVPGAAATVNFGSRPDEAFAALRRHRPGDPLFCMEFWNGWFDHWGEPHHVRGHADAADTLERMLAAGASVNLYMAHGGTSFGCTAGANHDGRYQPTVTSYDYDAPLDERGAPTAKFSAYREVIGRYADLPGDPPPPLPPVLPAREVPLGDFVPLDASFDHLATVHASSPHPPTFEELGVDHGLVRYAATILGPRRTHDLAVEGLADRAHVFVDGRFVTVLERDSDCVLPLDVPDGGRRVELLVESMGRVNYGPLLGERKGLVGGVRHAGQAVHGWEATALPLPGLPAVPWGAVLPGAGGPRATAGWHRGRLHVDEPGDAYLALPGWGKGYAWVNGFCLGRHWERGPQRTLFVPAPVLAHGSNEVVVLELDGRADARVELVDRPELGGGPAQP